jgi:hypothetical protein
MYRPLSGEFAGELVATISKHRRRNNLRMIAGDRLGAVTRLSKAADVRVR